MFTQKELDIPTSCRILEGSAMEVFSSPSNWPMRSSPWPKAAGKPMAFSEWNFAQKWKKQFKSIWKSMKHLKIEGLRSSCDLPIGFEWCAVTGACTPCSCHSQASRPWHTFDSPHNSCPKIYFHSKKRIMNCQGTLISAANGIPARNSVKACSVISWVWVKIVYPKMWWLNRHESTNDSIFLTCDGHKAY